MIVDMLSEQQKKTIKEWVDRVVNTEETESGFDSMEITDLLGISEDDGEIVQFSFAAYKEVLKQYIPASDKLIASMYFNLEFVDNLEKHTFDEIISNQSLLRQPPEIYLAKRPAYVEYYVVEEYKKSFDQDFIKPDKGVVYSYYEASNSDDFFSQTFAFRHYLTDTVELIGQQ